MKQLLITIAAVVLVGCGPKAPDISIHEAARNGYLADVKHHLDAGTDVNARDKDGATPLDLAIAHARESLVLEGATVDSKTVDLLRKHGGKTGADFAGQDIQFLNTVQSMDVERAKKILSEGSVNINIKGFGRDAPPIYNAAYHYNAEMTKLLIENGADLSKKDFQGETALHTAAFHCPGKGISVIQLLLNAGADVNAKRNDGKTPLDLATMGFRSKGALAPPGFSSSSNKMRQEYQKVVQLLMRYGGRASK